MNERVYYRTIFIRETEKSILFGNRNLTLEFDHTTGKLRKITSNLFEKQAVASDAHVEELLFKINGKVLSNLDESRKNDVYPSLQLVDAEVQGKYSTYVEHSVTLLLDRIQFNLTCRIGDFKVIKRYILGSGDILSRSLEFIYLGQGEVSLQEVMLTIPGIQYRENGLSMIEMPGVRLPETFDVLDEKCHLAPVTPDKYDCDHCLPHVMLQATLVHDRQNSFTLGFWPGNVKKEESKIKVCGDENQFSIRQYISVYSSLRNGDSVIFGENNIICANKSWEDTVSLIGDWYRRGIHSSSDENLQLLRSLMVYETQIGEVRFKEDVAHHRYKNVDELAADLPRIKEMGFTVLELMPSFPFPGYSVYDLKNVPMQYGGGQDIKQLIQEAHAIGMKVVLDVLLHGCVDRQIARHNVNSFTIRKYFFSDWTAKGEEISSIRANNPDWFIYDEDGEIFKKYTWTFDPASEGFQNYLLEALKIYVNEYGINGFRFDAPTWSVGPNRHKNLPYRSGKSIVAGIYEMFSKARAELDPLKENLIWITEPEGMAFRDILDVTYSYSTWEWWEPLFHGEFTARQLQKYYAVRKRLLPGAGLYINFCDNHDSWFYQEEGRFQYERYGTQFTRALFALALFQEGAFMEYAGFESPDEEYYKLLLKIRNDRPVFQKGFCSYEAASAEKDHILCICWKDTGEELTVCINFCNEKINSGIAGTEGSRWVNLIDQRSINPRAIQFKPYEVMILSSGN